jgi:hypothetical protein
MGSINVSNVLLRKNLHIKQHFMKCKQEVQTNL